MAAWDARMVVEGKGKFASKKFINQLSEKAKVLRKAVKTKSAKVKSKTTASKPKRKVSKAKVSKKETKHETAEPKTKSVKENAQVLVDKFC
jgi:predicted Zn-dependent protease